RHIVDRGARCVGILARQQGRSRRRTQRTVGHRLRELDPLPRQPVDIGRVYLLVPGAAHIHAAPLIGHDEENVRRPLGNCHGRSRKKELSPVHQTHLISRGGATVLTMVWWILAANTPPASKRVRLLSPATSGCTSGPATGGR